MTPEEAKKAGCKCYGKWPQYKPIRDMITDICNEFVEDSEGNCANCEHDEECHDGDMKLSDLAKDADREMIGDDVDFGLEDIGSK